MLTSLTYRFANHDSNHERLGRTRGSRTGSRRPVIRSFLGQLNSQFGLRSMANQSNAWRNTIVPSFSGIAPLAVLPILFNSRLDFVGVELVVAVVVELRETRPNHGRLFLGELLVTVIVETADHPPGQFRYVQWART